MRSEDEQIAAFVRERNHALSVGGKILDDFYRKWGVAKPSNPEVAERARLKAITGIPGLPKEQRQAAKDELSKRGSSSMDDGDLT